MPLIRVVARASDAGDSVVMKPIPSLQTQLRAAHHDLAVLRAEALRHQQRERLHRDLHEDVGALLLSLIYRADSDPLAALARSALQDLRDVVRRADLADVPLIDALADWRCEATQQVEAARGRLAWSQQPDLPAHVFTADCAMRWGRVVRHVVAALIYEQVEQVHMQVSYAAPYLLLEIERGPLLDPHKRRFVEQGVAALRRRVTTLAGQLEWRATTVRREDGRDKVTCRIPLTT